jgi:hypothetical protein
MRAAGSAGGKGQPVFAGLATRGFPWSRRFYPLAIEYALLAAAVIVHLLSAGSDGQNYIQPGMDDSEQIPAKRYRCDHCKEEQSWDAPPPSEELRCTGCDPPQGMRLVRET